MSGTVILWGSSVDCARQKRKLASKERIKTRKLVKKKKKKMVAIAQ